jgi:hypothetical protein
MGLRLSNNRRIRSPGEVLGALLFGFSNGFWEKLLAEAAGEAKKKWPLPASQTR